MLGTKLKIAAVSMLALGSGLLEQRAPAAAPMVVAQAAPNIREQQAEKDFKVGEFYRRTGHPGTACFYYDMVCRRYPGTRAARQATMRLRDLRQKGQRANQDHPAIVARLNGKVILEEPVDAAPGAPYLRQFDRVLGLVGFYYEVVYANCYTGEIEARECGQ